ncbi:MAG: amidophosphoribosyltransferase, partial [Halothiobacillus sp.]
ADRLIYQDLHDLIESVRAGNPSLKAFDCSCFTGDYITGDIDENYLSILSERRSDRSKNAPSNQSRDIVAVGLYNVQ